MAKRKTTGKPKPPADITDESLLEWGRVVKELADVGMLHRANRAYLCVYVRTWQTWHSAAAVVAQDGPVVLLPNNWPGQSAEFKTMNETAKLLEKMLTVMGLSPRSHLKLQEEASELPEY